MKTIGLLGGMSWESTVPYYRIINEVVRARRGGLHSANVLLHSFDFEQVAALQQAGDWAALTALLGGAAAALRNAGAQAFAICTNTMHKDAADIEALAGIPLLHIADAAAAAILKAGLKKVGLLGTRFTMEGAFYREHLREQYGIEVLIPELPQRELVHRVIYEELCRGEINPASQSAFQSVVRQLEEAGAQGVVMGCTEIPMLLQQADVSIPLFDTAVLHAHYIAEWALSAN